MLEETRSIYIYGPNKLASCIKYEYVETFC